MQFMSVGSKSITGNMLTTDVPGYGPYKIKGHSAYNHSSSIVVFYFLL